MRAGEIPVAHTPPGGYGDEMPPPVLEGCAEPLVPGAPDMRGVWRVVAVDWRVEALGEIHLDGHVQRIEQCGDRVCITSSGVIHDMRADGTVEHGVNDVSALTGAPVSAVCTFEDGVHTLRPVGVADVEVRRRLEGDQLVWEYRDLFVARLERLGSSEPESRASVSAGAEPKPTASRRTS